MANILKAFLLPCSSNPEKDAQDMESFLKTNAFNICGLMIWDLQILFSIIFLCMFTFWFLLVRSNSNKALKHTF